MAWLVGRRGLAAAVLAATLLACGCGKLQTTGPDTAPRHRVPFVIEGRADLVGPMQLFAAVRECAAATEAPVLGPAGSGS
jgi:hypothetical protein